MERDSANAPGGESHPPPDAATVVDATGCILDINEAAASIVGLTVDEMLGSPIVPHIHSDDRSLAARLLGEALTDGASGPVELRVLVPGGGWVWLRCVTTRLANDPSRARIALEDASIDRRLSEQLERTTEDLHREHAELLRRSEAMSDLAALLTGSHGLDHLIRGLAGVALRHLAPLVVIMLVEGEKIRVVQLNHANHRAEALLRKSIAHLPRGELSLTGPIRVALERGEPEVNLLGPFHPDLPGLIPEFLAEFGIGARAIFPMRTSQQSIGVLLLGRHTGAPRFSPADVDLARALAGRAALAVDAARSDELRRRAEAVSRQRAVQQEAIAELGSSALAGVPLDDLALRCRELVQSALGVTHCVVLMSEDDEPGMRLMASSARTDEEVEARRTFGPALLEALHRNGSLIIGDVDQHDAYGLHPRLRRDGVRSLAISRIESGGGASGLLAAASFEVNRFEPDDVVFLAAMANVLASAMDGRRALEDLHRIATHDALTGLPNRDFILRSLETALDGSAPGRRVAVLVCDVDRFKVVNDALGHSAGDDVLRSFAGRLTGSIRPGDTVGRFGGDEFVVVCPNVASFESVTAIAARLASTFASPLSVMGTQVVSTASIGIAVSNGDGPESAIELVRDADAAMYRAKENGRSRYEVFDDGMRQRANHRLRTETELRAALDFGQLVLHYQPIVSARDGELFGVEALVRWDHAERGLLPPSEFVSVAVECGLAPELGEWALETAARDAARWAEAGPGHPRWVAVNLAAQQLKDPSLLSRIDAVLQRTGADPSALRLEITEEVLVEDTLNSTQVLGALRARGVGISVDDFGTGYSSLAYLKRLPVDCLKLDGSFVRSLPDDEGDMVISAAVIVMAGALGLDVVAECVETSEQVDVLRAMGCGQIQGFYVSPALPADELDVWVERWPGLPQPI